MKNQSRKNRWKTLIVGAMAATIIAAPLAVVSHADSHMDSQTEVMSANPEQVSGTVERYFTDRSGLVTAMDVSGTEHRVRFAPSWASRLWQNYPVGSKFDGWVVEDKNGICNLVAIGADRPNRFLTNDFHTGTERLLSTAWIWENSATETVTGELNKVIVSEKGEVLALELRDGTLIRVPMNVKHQEEGARGSKHVAQLFKGARVTAWGPQVWNARGDVSIYGQRIAATGLSINGKTVSAIGIQNMSTNASLLGSIFDQTKGGKGEFSPFEADMIKQTPAPTMK